MKQLTVPARGGKENLDPKHCVAFLDWWALDFQRKIFEDVHLWYLPMEAGEKFENLGRSGYGAVNEHVDGWALWQHVPDPDGIGRAFTKEEFEKSRWRGNFAQLFRDIFEKHRDEAFELSGEWIYVDGPVPLDYWFWHIQFAHNQEERYQLIELGAAGSLAKGQAGWWDEQAVEPKLAQMTCSSVLKFPMDRLKAGGEIDGHGRRKAKVMTLPQIFMIDPVNVSAQAAYSFAMHLRKIVKKRHHPV